MAPGLEGVALIDMSIYGLTTAPSSQLAHGESALALHEIALIGLPLEHWSA